MKSDALIIGGGLSGITTAHRLAKRGCSVVLVEANEDVGLGANFANGAMLVPSQIHAMEHARDIVHAFEVIRDAKFRSADQAEGCPLSVQIGACAF